MLPENLQNNPIVRHSFEFAVMIDSYCNKLIDQRKYDLGRQLFRAGTSIGANVFEAQHAESKADFIHKMKISSKEAHETLFWLYLCKNGEHYPDCEQMFKKLEEIQRIQSSILSSSKK